MAIEVIKENFQSNKLKGTEENQTLIETQIYLSPTKPEIEKLIWVKTKADILDTRLMKDKLMVTGRIKFDVLYKGPDEERNLHTLDSDVEFREEIFIEGINEEMESFIEARVEHTEWEIFENKLDLQSLLNLKVEVREIKEFELATVIHGDDSLETLDEKINYRGFFAQQISYGTIQEKILLEDDLPEIDKILNFNIRVKEQETIIAEDRIITSAQVFANIIYYGIDQIHSLEEEFSLNHFIEMEGVDSTYIPKVKFEDIQGNYEILTNELGENKIIDLDIRIKIIGESHYENLQNLIVDLYSTTNELEIYGEEIELTESIKTLDHKEEIDLDLGEIDALEILDIEAHANNLQRYIEEDLIIDSILSLDIIYIDRMTGELDKFSGDFPFRTIIDGNLESDIDIKLESRVDDIRSETKRDGLGLTVEIIHNIELLKSRRVYGITDLQKGIESLSHKDRPSITVYIVQKGDTMWDIAKRYKTTMNMIQSLKDGEEELKQGDKIIIEKQIQDIEI